MKPDLSGRFGKYAFISNVAMTVAMAATNHVQWCFVIIHLSTAVEYALRSPASVNGLLVAMTPGRHRCSHRCAL